MSTDTQDWPKAVSSDVARRTADTQAILAMDHAPSGVLSDWTRLRLAEILTHAMTGSAWWRDRLGLRPTAPILDAWAAQGILNRTQLQASISPEQPLSMPEFHGTPTRLSTQGNTGPALQFYTSQHTQRMAQGQHHADHVRHGRDLSRLRVNLTERMQPHTSPQVVIRALEPLGEAAAWGRHVGHSDMLGHAKWLSSLKPAYLVADTPVLEALLDCIETHQMATPRIEQVLPFGATLTAGLRQAAARVWGAVVKDRYVVEEVGPVAMQCPISDDYLHVAATHVVVDVVRADDSPASVGEVGRVLVTGLHHWATPIIRLDTGDHAALHQRCPGCGANVPTLSDLVGHGMKATEQQSSSP